MAFTMGKIWPPTLGQEFPHWMTQEEYYINKLKLLSMNRYRKKFTSIVKSWHQDMADLSISVA